MSNYIFYPKLFFESNLTPSSRRCAVQLLSQYTIPQYDTKIIEIDDKNQSSCKELTDKIEDIYTIYDKLYMVEKASYYDYKHTINADEYLSLPCNLNVLLFYERFVKLNKQRLSYSLNNILESIELQDKINKPVRYHDALFTKLASFFVNTNIAFYHKIQGRLIHFFFYKRFDIDFFIQKFCELSEKHERNITNFMQRWKISKHNIYKHYPYLKDKCIYDMNILFMDKKKTIKPNDLPKYTNAVFSNFKKKD